MCSCLRSITCCWDDPPSRGSKQEEVAENERNHPYIISPPGYINAAFEDAAASPVVIQPQQHCDITIEAPPRQTLLGSIPLAANTLETSSNPEREVSVTAEHVPNLKDEPSTSQSVSPGQGDVNLLLPKNQDQNIGCEENPSTAAESVSDSHSGPSDNQRERGNPDSENTKDSADINERTAFHWHPVSSIAESAISEVGSELPNQEESNEEQSRFHWHPVTSITESQVSEVESEDSSNLDRDQRNRESFLWQPVCSMTESQISEVESEPVNQIENNLNNDSLDMIDSETSDIPQVQPIDEEPCAVNTLTLLPMDSIILANDDVPSESYLSHFVDQEGACAVNTLTILPNDSTTTNEEVPSELTMSQPVSANIDIPSIRHPEDYSSNYEPYSEDETFEDGPRDLFSPDETSFVSLITIVHGEDDAVQYQTLRPRTGLSVTGLSMESVDSAISMGSSPSCPGGLHESRSFSSDYQLGNSTEALNNSGDYNEGSFDFDAEPRPRFVSVASVTTCLTYLDNDEATADFARKVSDVTDDQSDGELNISDGETSLCEEENKTLSNDEDVLFVTNNEENSNAICDEDKDQNKTDQADCETDDALSHFDFLSQSVDVMPDQTESDQYCLQNDACILQNSTLKTTEDVISDVISDANDTLANDTLEDSVVDNVEKRTAVEQSPAQDISIILNDNETTLDDPCDVVPVDISTSEEQLTYSQHNPIQLKELVAEKLVDIVYTASHLESDVQDLQELDTSSETSLKDKIRSMLMSRVHELQPHNDLPNILTHMLPKDKEAENNEDNQCEALEEMPPIEEEISALEKLEMALQSGDRIETEEALQKLITSGCANDISDINKSDCPVVFKAAKWGHQFFFEMLKESEIDFKLKDASGYYPIHYAVLSGDSNLVDFFIEEGHIDVLTDNKETALHLAVKEGDVHMSRQLAEAAKQSSTSLEVQDHDGMTPLHLAVSADHVEIVRCLIYHGYNVNSMTSKGLSVVMLAARKEQFEIAEILLSNGASPLTEDARGNNILHYFVSSKSYLMLDVILAHYYPKDAIDNQNFEGQSALHKAAMNGDEVAVLSLLNNGANIDLPDQEGRTVLLLCATECHAGLLTTLVTLGANVHHQDNYGDNILHYIARTGNGTVTDFLVHQCRMNPDTKNNSGQTAMHVAAKYVHSDVIAVLLTSRVELNIQDNAGRTPLHEACCNGNLTVVAQLVYSGAHVNARDENNMKPVVLAGLRHAVDIVQYLVSKDNDSESLYDLANFALPDDILFLKSHNVDLDKQDQKGNTALHHALNHRNERVAKLLLEAGVSAILLDNQGNSALHLACASSSVEMIDLLIKSLCLIDSHNKKGETPAYIAATEKRYHILTLLVRNGANLNTKLRDGRTLIFVAVENNDVELTELLMSHGADVNYICSGNMTRPIHVAAKLGHKEVMAVLLKVVTEVDIAEFFSRKSPLHFAAEAGWTEVVLQLLAVRADVNLETGCGEKALHLAAREGHARVVESLLQAGTQLSLLDEDGCPRYDLSKHRHIWASIKSWALQHPSTVSSQRRLPAALASLRSVIREAFRVHRSSQHMPDMPPPPYM